MRQLPDIHPLEAVEPSNKSTGDQQLEYDNLADWASQSSAAEAQRWTALNESEEAQEEAYHARQLAFGYLVLTAEKATNKYGIHDELWADRFTTAAIELYGMPDSDEIAIIITDRLLLLDSTNEKEAEPEVRDAVELLRNTYRNAIGDQNTANAEQTLDTFSEVAKSYGEYLRERYQGVFEAVERFDPNIPLEPVDQVKVFQEALNWLEDSDGTEWAGWEVVLKEGSVIKVLADDKQIIIGRNRKPAKPKDLEPLLAHELLTHAVRAKNGYKVSTLLGKGLPGYLDFEEGLAKISEHAITGKPPTASQDTYLYIGLALGLPNGGQLTRHELAEVIVASSRLKAYEEGKTFDLDKTKSTAYAKVDRIYRGGKGGRTVDEKQAILPKDIVYYNGYQIAKNWIMDRITQGDDLRSIIGYLMQGKFDPTDTSHTTYLAEQKSKPVI